MRDFLLVALVSRRTHLMSPQNPDDLVFRSLLPLHRPLSSQGSDSKSKWRKSSMASQQVSQSGVDLALSVDMTGALRHTF